MTADDLAALKAQITANEGRKAYLYDDATGERIIKGSVVKGHPTWGVGFNTDAMPFSQQVIDLALGEKLDDVIAEVTTALPWTNGLPSGPLRAILDIGYNTGLEGLLGFHKMLGFAQQGNFAAAANEVIDSTLAPARKQRLAVLIRS